MDPGNRNDCMPLPWTQSLCLLLRWAPTRFLPRVHPRLSLPSFSYSCALAMFMLRNRKCCFACLSFAWTCACPSPALTATTTLTLHDQLVNLSLVIIPRKPLSRFPRANFTLSDPAPSRATQSSYSKTPQRPSAARDKSSSTNSLSSAHTRKARRTCSPRRTRTLRWMR